MSIGNKQIMANNIKRFLNAKNMNPHQLSIELGFKYTTVNDWVNAKTYPRIDKIEKMADFFKVSKSDLVEEYKPVKSGNTTAENDNFPVLNGSASNVFIGLRSEFLKTLTESEKHDLYKALGNELKKSETKEIEE